MRRSLILICLALPLMTGCKLCREKTGRVCGDGPNDNDPSEQTTPTRDAPLEDEIIAIRSGWTPGVEI